MKEPCARKTTVTPKKNAETAFFRIEGVKFAITHERTMCKNSVLPLLWFAENKRRNEVIYG